MGPRSFALGMRFLLAMHVLTARMPFPVRGIAALQAESALLWVRAGGCCTWKGQVLDARV